MFEIILVMQLANLTILAIWGYQLNPLIFRLWPSYHLILFNPLIEEISMVVFIHLVEVLSEVGITV